MYSTTLSRKISTPLPASFADAPEVLDIWSVDLAQYRSLLQKGDQQAAQHWLADFWKIKLTRTSHQLSRMPGESSAILETANRLLKGRVSVLNMPEIDLGSPIDWFAYSDQDLQATNHLAYMYWINPLAWAYAQTGNEAYAEKWFQIVEDFLEHHYYGCEGLLYLPSVGPWADPDMVCNNGEGFYRSGVIGPWISLACHARIDHWLAGLSRLAGSRAASYPRLLEILSALMGDHARLIVNNPRSNTPNQYIANTISLLKLTLLFPEFKVSTGYFRVAESWLSEYLSSYLLPDGSDREQSLNYNLAMASQLLNLLAILPENANKLRDVVKRAGAARTRFLAIVATPSLQLPALAKTHSTSIRDQLTAWATAFGATDIVALLQGTLKTRGASCCRVFPYGGYNVLRDTWASDATHLFFKTGGMSVGHMHEDTLHFTLTLQGREAIVDSSNYNYNNAADIDRRMGAYCHSSWAHAAILVDEGGQQRIAKRAGFSQQQLILEKLPNVARESESFAFVEGLYADGFSGVEESGVHYRQILWIKKYGYLVHDVLSFQGVHHYTQCWPLSSRFHYNDVEMDARQGVIFARGEAPHVVIQRLAGAPVQMETHYGEELPTRGWGCPDYNIRVPKPDVHIRWNGEGPQQILTWIGSDTLQVSAHSEKEGISLKLPDGETLQVHWQLGASVTELDVAVTRGSQSSTFGATLKLGAELPSQCRSSEKLKPIRIPHSL